MQMEKEFIPYEEALALKALDFDEPCNAYYWRKELTNPLSKSSNNFKTITHKDIHEIHCLAPLYQQAFRWFREKHNLDSSYGTTNDYNPNVHGYVVSKFDKDNRRVYLDKNWEVGSYEEAELACLQKLIEIVKSKDK